MVIACGGDSVVRMAVMKAEPNSRAAAVRPADGRSPFVRLAELLAEHKPGQSPINLAVGEPQHPVPSFVGPVLAAHIPEFGRYPPAKETKPSAPPPPTGPPPRIGSAAPPMPSRRLSVLMAPA